VDKAAVEAVEAVEALVVAEAALVVVAAEGYIDADSIF